MLSACDILATLQARRKLYRNLIYDYNLFCKKYYKFFLRLEHFVLSLHYFEEMELFLIFICSFDIHFGQKAQIIIQKLK